VPKEAIGLLGAVFLDRDGVINENREDYVKSIDELRLLPGAAEAVSLLNTAGFKVVLVSNQQCIGRGLITHETLAEINQALLSQLTAAGAEIAGIYYCPHLKEDLCSCRKPKPGLLLKAAKELDIDLTESILVGDNATDIEAGRSAGCFTILALSGKTRPSAVPGFSHKPDHVVADLREAVEWILHRFLSG
jgi:D-glycero-D-manno-heptose 1,7-bisphosphate phosphatase